MMVQAEPGGIPDADERLEAEERIVRGRFWSKLRANLHRLPFLDHLLAAYFCALDPATPARAKAVLLGALAYFILPFDAVPDILLVAGFTDDAAVLMAALRTVQVNLRPHHYERARVVLEAEREAADAAAA
ncbi:YkvA family protein [Azospirillum halopraeferens]|uniref:YkvA family protein n=1 Tax=Azospirillum halopraeferens TaxID=34010 RepID=UPI0003FF605B|nr:YkvA family protein [Azospirillum halopraeferens]